MASLRRRFSVGNRAHERPAGQALIATAAAPVPTRQIAAAAPESTRLLAERPEFSQRAFCAHAATTSATAAPGQWASRNLSDHHLDMPAHGDQTVYGPPFNTHCTRSKGRRPCASPATPAERLTAQSRPVTNPHTWRAEPIQRPNTDQLLAIVQILDSQD